MASGKVPRLFLAMLVAGQAAAYDHPLGSHAIREAYFLGSGNQFAEALSSYTKKLPVPKTSPHVAQIEVRTTYAQVIVGSHEHFVGYSAQYAETDYKKNPARWSTFLLFETIVRLLFHVLDSLRFPCSG